MVKVSRWGRQRAGVQIFRRIGDPGFGKRLPALDTGAAVDLATFLAGPSLGVVHAEVVTELGDGGFIQMDEGPQQLDPGVGPLAHGCCDALHERLPAVGIYGAISRMGGDGNGLCAPAFGDSAGDG